MHGLCCDLEYCQVADPILNTAHGRIWPPSDIHIGRWQHMHYTDESGNRLRERGCFWKAIIPGKPEAGNQSHPYPDDPKGLTSTMASLS